MANPCLQPQLSDFRGYPFSSPPVEGWDYLYGSQSSDGFSHQFVSTSNPSTTLTPVLNYGASPWLPLSVRSVDIDPSVTPASVQYSVFNSTSNTAYYNSAYRQYTALKQDSIYNPSTISTRHSVNFTNENQMLALRRFQIPNINTNRVSILNLCNVGVYLRLYQGGSMVSQIYASASGPAIYGSSLTQGTMPNFSTSLNNRLELHHEGPQFNNGTWGWAWTFYGNNEYIHSDYAEPVNGLIFRHDFGVAGDFQLIYPIIIVLYA